MGIEGHEGMKNTNRKGNSTEEKDEKTVHLYFGEL